MFYDPPIPTPTPTSIPYSEALGVLNKASDTLVTLSNIGPQAIFVSLGLAILMFATGWVLKIVLIDRKRVLAPPSQNDKLNTELVSTMANLVRYNEAQDERARIASDGFQKLIKELSERHIESLTAFTAAFHASDDRIAKISTLQLQTDARITNIEKALELVTADGSPAVKDIRKVVNEIQERLEPLKQSLETEPAFRERVESTLKEVLATLKEKKRKTDEIKSVPPPVASTPTGSP